MTAALIGGAVGGAVGGATMAALSGGNLNEIVSAGLQGALAGAITGGVAGHYNNSWNLSVLKSVERMAAQSLAGGISSKVNGGSFNQGLKVGLVTSMMNIGWSYAKRSTIALKTKTEEYGGKAMFDSKGNVLVAGSRGYADGRASKSIFAWMTMLPEGNGKHIGFDQDSVIGRFVNDVGYLHDFGNSWGYDWTTGFVDPAMNTGIKESLYDVWSFASMLPAAAVTGAAHSPANVAIYDQAQ